jgi:hypothetical protein
MQREIGLALTHWLTNWKRSMAWPSTPTLHRKEGSASNADYWYQRSGRRFYRPTLEAEWEALVDGLLSGAEKA